MTRSFDPRMAALSGAVVALLLVAGCQPKAKLPTIQNKGSDTMIEAAQAWAEKYDKANVEVSGGGSGVGITSLVSGTIDLCNASRHMTPDEERSAKDKTGKDPVLHVVGYDALAIYVHKDNPLESITMAQLKDLWGEGGKITKWSDLGVKVPGCDSDEIVLIGRQNNSGTYEYLKEAVLGKAGKYKLTVSAAPGSKDLVKRVGQTPCAIGYSGMGYRTDAVKFLKVTKEGGQPTLPSVAAVHDHSYPLSRPLYMYTLGEATGAVAEYVDWVTSDAGQAILDGIGYIPLKPGDRTGSKEPEAMPKSGG